MFIHAILLLLVGNSIISNYFYFIFCIKWKNRQNPYRYLNIKQIFVHDVIHIWVGIELKNNAVSIFIENNINQVKSIRF